MVMRLAHELKKAPPVNDSQWRALVDHDARADGTFVYGVKTMGIYCCPSCSSRAPKRANVVSFPTPKEAEQAGYRGCYRCNPNGVSMSKRTATLIAAACRTIETAAKKPTLGALAATAKLSPFHFRRYFKTATGLSPKQYAASARAKRGHRAEEIRYALGLSSLGSLLVAQSSKGIHTISIGDEPDTLIREFKMRLPQARLVDDDPAFGEVVEGVAAFIDRPSLGLDLPLDVQGSAFEKRVWRALRGIPAGKTASYAEVARLVDAPTGARAVARACAANTIAVAIPCHRVVRSNGELSGYRWGVERKRALLAKEADGGTPSPTLHSKSSSNARPTRQRTKALVLASP
jgi:AraC family transcriptional regulator, regulatory protein of adaptative response / methylated-DNA-[protein]-cysteine methyltransferase